MITAKATRIHLRLCAHKYQISRSYIVCIWANKPCAHKNPMLYMRETIACFFVGIFVLRVDNCDLDLIVAIVVWFLRMIVSCGCVAYWFCDKMCQSAMFCGLFCRQLLQRCGGTCMHTKRARHIESPSSNAVNTILNINAAHRYTVG